MMQYRLNAVSCLHHSIGEDIISINHYNVLHLKKKAITYGSQTEPWKKIEPCKLLALSPALSFVSNLTHF
jgi:hypothetical protein